MIDNPNYMPQVLQVIAVPGDGYLILLYFDDGSIHQYDVAPLLDQPVFRPLRDRALFRRTLTPAPATKRTASTSTPWSSTAPPRKSTSPLG